MTVTKFSERILLWLGWTSAAYMYFFHKYSETYNASPHDPPSAASFLEYNKRSTDYATILYRMESDLTFQFPSETPAQLDLLLQEDGTFSDMDYDNLGGQPQFIIQHASRLQGVVLQNLQERRVLSRKAEASFIYLTYKMPNITSLNLWDHVIGIPRTLYQIVFVARDHLKEEDKTVFLDRYFAYGRHGPVWNPTLDHPDNVGASLAIRTYLGLVEYLLRGKLPEYHRQVKAALYKELILKDVYQGDGMRQDGCLHQHNRAYYRKNNEGKSEYVILTLVYNNNYGKEFVKWSSRVMWLLAGTKFQLGDEIEEGIFASFLECHQWLNRWKTVEPSTVGRFIDSGKRVTGGDKGLREALKYLGRVPRHRQEIMAAIHRYVNPIPDDTYALNGNKHFFVSDLMAHQRQSFMASLRILSRRTCRPETIPPAGYSKKFYYGTSKGYFLGDGFLTVLVHGRELGSIYKEIFQAYDWARIPGATIHYTDNVPQVTTSRINTLKHSYNDADFVGGVSNGKEGLATMNYSRPTVSLKAKKSWFFFDTVILCLGSGISLPAEDVTEHQVTTTLNQVLYNGIITVGEKTKTNHYYYPEPAGERHTENYNLTNNVWFHHDSIGYVPILNEGNVTFEVSDRSIYGPKNTSIQIFSLWLNHGPKPNLSEYAYAILPGHSIATTREFASHPTAKILSLTNSQHVACFDPLKILGMVFFSEGCFSLNTCIASRVEMICTDVPSLLLLKDLQSTANKTSCPDGITRINMSSGDHNLTQESQTIQISIADPTQKLNKTTLKFFLENETEHIIPIKLTPPPKSGASVVICLELH